MMMVVLRWALAAGLLASLAFCVLGFSITFGTTTDRVGPSVYSLLIVLYGIGSARTIRPALRRA